MIYLNSFVRVIHATNRRSDVWFLGLRMETIVLECQHTSASLDMKLLVFELIGEIEVTYVFHNVGANAGLELEHDNVGNWHIGRLLRGQYRVSIVDEQKQSTEKNENNR